MRCSVVSSARGGSSTAVPVWFGEMGSKAYLGGEGVRYRIGGRSALLLNEEGMAKLLVGGWRTRYLAASLVAPVSQVRAMQLRFAGEEATLISHSHVVTIKPLCKASVS